MKIIPEIQPVVNNILKYSKDVICEHKTGALTVAVSAPLFLYGYYFFKRPVNMPPGPLGYPYIGSMLEISGDVPSDFSRIGKKYGNIFCLWTGGSKYIIVLNSYEIIKEAYISKGSYFADRDPCVFFGGYDIPDNLFNSHYDENYKTTRKVTTQALRKFVSTKLDDLIDSEFDKLEEYLSDWGEESLNIATPAQLIFTNVVSSILFDKTFPFGHQDLTFLRDEAVKNFNLGGNYVFSTLINENIFNKKPKISSMAEMNESRQYIHRKIEEHLSTLDESNPRDMIDLYLIAGCHDKVGREIMCNNILALMPDAINSGSIAIEWLSLYLLKYPQYVNIIRNEIDSVVGTGFVQLRHRPEMPLTESFFMEVFRIRSPQVMGFLNKAEPGATIAGYNIPQGACVVANYMSVHFDAAIYPEPFEFKPERFLNSGKLVVEEKLVPFGMGRRKCVGEHLMRNMLFLVLANLVKNYDLTTEEQIDLTASLDTGSNRPQDIKLHLKHRMS